MESVITSDKKFSLPPCWSDDVRMRVLFAVPRNEAINPLDWISKYKFWKELITEWATANGVLIVDITKLKEAFSRKGQVPASLERVLQEMHKQGDVILVENILKNNSNSSWVSWGFGIIKSSTVWSWNKVMESLWEVEKQLPRYAFPSVLEERCKNIMEIPPALMGEVIEVSELMELYPKLFPSQEETQLALSSLQKSGKIAMDTISAETVVKFIQSEKKDTVDNQKLWSKLTSMSPVKSKESTKITEVDRSLATLKRTEKLLSEEIENLHKEITSSEQTARTKLKEGSRTAAKAALYRKKQFQLVSDKRCQALTNIQTMILQLVQAQTDAKVIEAYQIGLSALKSSFSDLPLNEDKVQDTLVELEQVLEQHRDIEDALANTISVDEDDNELEEELMLLLETSNVEPTEMEMHFPAVPTESPAAFSFPNYESSVVSLTTFY